MGGLQAALIVALQITKEKHLQWPLTLMAVMSAALLAAGVLRHYWDIYIHRTVRGISFLFVGIDAAGDVFSLASVVFQPKLDILGIIIYGTELVLWIGVFACGGYYNLIPWLRKRMEKRKQDRRSSFAMHHHPPHDGVNERDGGGVTEPVTLHDMPSSTSVFRTPSGELDSVRERGSFTRRNTGERA